MGEVLLKGGRRKKLYLCERARIDRRAMRVSTKFRANKSVSEAGEEKKKKKKKKTSAKIQTDHFSAKCGTNKDLVAGDVHKVRAGREDAAAQLYQRGAGAAGRLPQVHARKAARYCSVRGKTSREIGDMIPGEGERGFVQEGRNREPRGVLNFPRINRH